MSLKKAVIIIPTYNEKDNILPTSKALFQVFKKISNYNMSILFVDDNSPDGTSQQIIHLQKTHPNVYLLKNKTKKGLGYAYKKGMRYALDKLGADVVFEFDADLSHDPQKIPLMLSKIDAGSDLVLGSRYIKGGGIPANWPLHRKFLSLAGNLFINTILLNFSIRDWTTGYRAIRKEVVAKIIPNLQHRAFNGYTWQIGFLIKTLEAGFQVSEVPFVFKDRTAGISKLGPEYIINTMAYILKVRLTSLLRSRVFKFLVVGSIGTLVQLSSLYLYRALLPYHLSYQLLPFFQLTSYLIAVFLSIETAITSNFLLNNTWTFADKKLPLSRYPLKFLQFNLTSFGSILIQLVTAFLGEHFIGLHQLFTIKIPFFTHFTFSVDTGLVYVAIGIIIGLFWNFFAYTRIIWTTKH